MLAFLVDAITDGLKELLGKALVGHFLGVLALLDHEVLVDVLERQAPLLSSLEQGIWDFIVFEKNSESEVLLVLLDESLVAEWELSVQEVNTLIHSTDKDRLVETADETLGFHLIGVSLWVEIQIVSLQESFELVRIYSLVELKDSLIEFGCQRREVIHYCLYELGVAILQMHLPFGIACEDEDTRNLLLSRSVPGSLG